MTNFEYFIWLLQGNEDLEKMIDLIDFAMLPTIVERVVCCHINEYVENLKKLTHQQEDKGVTNG